MSTGSSNTPVILLGCLGLFREHIVDVVHVELKTHLFPVFQPVPELEMVRIFMPCVNFARTVMARARLIVLESKSTTRLPSGCKISV